ncbi:MAG: hypothetical protein EON94_15040, partial [Caulobacteraceae bacterium]
MGLLDPHERHRPRHGQTDLNPGTGASRDGARFVFRIQLPPGDRPPPWAAGAYRMTFKTLDDADLAGKRALVRVDLNVPMH